MRMNKQIETWIKYVVPNLRGRWPAELANFSDEAIARTYDAFYFSDRAGNNDENFPEFFDLLVIHERASDVD